MEQLAVGSVVMVAFPFLSVKSPKLRPALVLANTPSHEVVFCQITSKPYGSRSAIKIEPANFESGSLPIIAYIHPDTLFTADASISNKTVGLLNQDMQRRVLAAVRALFI